jgi:S-adenosyl methyltransferase
VLAHARALLVNTTPQGATTYVDADVHTPDSIIADARTVLNLNEPVAVMFMGVLGHVADFDEARSIVARVMAAVPSGSYLALYDGTDTREIHREAVAKYAETGAVPYTPHTPRNPELIGQCFEGLEMGHPGLVSITQWRPETTEVGQAEPIDAYGAVARKP